MPLSAAGLAPTPLVPTLPRPTAAIPGIIRRVFAGGWLTLALGAGYLSLALLQRCWFPVARPRRWLDRWGSRRFVAYARTHGAMLIKIGQFIASRPDLFPTPWIEACAALRDQAPPRPFAVARAVLDEAFEGAVAERFAAIEPEPIAAASFGQVHRAWLRDGRMVAVKVQYPGLARRVAADLFLTRVAMRLIRIAMRGFPFNDLAAELERASRAELDYLQEAISADRLRPLLREHGLDAPQVVWEHTRSRVLVMEFAEGTTLARLDLATLPFERRLDLAERIVDAYLAMLLDAGFYHADPHAGNFIVGTDGRLWLIDFGMTAAVSRREVELYQRFMLHVQRQDIDGMIDVLLRLGFVMPEAEREDLRRLAEELYESLKDAPPQALKGSTRQSDIGWRINEMLRRADGLVFPQHTVMLSRATGMLEGLCGELVPEVSFLNLVRPLLTRRFTPWTQAKRFLEDAQQLWASLRTLPERLTMLRRGADWSAHAIVAGCALLAAMQLPEGTARIVAIGTAGVAAVMAMIRHGK